VYKPAKVRKIQLEKKKKYFQEKQRPEVVDE
jgi:hypothetical protein